MIELSGQLKKQIVEQAQSAPRQEACGILAGREGKVEKVYPLTNVSDAPESCYLMDPKEQFQVMKKMRQEGLEMLAIYHSHPESDAYPSARDVELAYYPDAAYVIVSLKNKLLPEIRAFRISEGKIEEEELAAQ